MTRVSGMESESPPWCVYIVRCADDTLYTGVTVDIDARLAAHNSGAGARYTRVRLPVDLVYTEPAADRAAAQRREWQIKQMTALAKRRLIGTSESP